MNIFLRIIKKSEKLLDNFANKKISLFQWIIALLCIIFVRLFLEYLKGRHEGFLTNFIFALFHFPFFYVITALSYLLLIYFVTKIDIKKLSILTLLIMGVICVGPLVDILFNYDDALIYKYPLATVKSPVSWNDLGSAFIKYSKFIFIDLPFVGNWTDYLSMVSESRGVLIEVPIIFLLMISFVYLKTKSVLKTWLVYIGGRLILFFLLFSKFIIANIFGAHFYLKGEEYIKHAALSPIFLYDDIHSVWFLTLIMICAGIWYWIYNKQKFLAVIKNVRLERLMMYISALFIGLYISLRMSPIDLNGLDILLLVSAILAVTFSWLTAVGSNDIADMHGDKKSGLIRPLTTNKLSVREVSELNILFRIVSYIFAYLAGYIFFITMLVRSCVAYLYSNEPFKLKKFPIISKLIIASAVFLGVVGGFALNKSVSIDQFPYGFGLMVIITLTLSLNIIDIKDYKGDKADKVYTIPVLFGLKRGKVICAVLSFLSFYVPFLFFRLPMFLIPAVIASIISFFLIIREKFNEKLVIFVYYLYTLPVLFYIIRFIL